MCVSTSLMLHPGAFVPESAFLDDIVMQPDALERALRAGLPASARRFARRQLLTGFDRVVLTGMGASLHAAYPAWLELAAAGVPAWHVDSSELLHHARGLLTQRTLLWITSQSGRSAEVLALLDAGSQAGLTVVATTNDPSSPLAESADVTLELHAGEESAVSTRSYVNSLAVNHLLVAAALSGDGREDLLAAPVALAAYLERWQERLEELRDALWASPRLLLVGRGPSLASARAGALILKEAAKVAAEGSGAAEFRHGPMELAAPTLALLAFAGDLATRGLMAALAADAGRFGAHVVWLGERDGAPEASRVLPMPLVRGPARGIGEIVPVQLLCIALAEREGVEAGTFRHLSKVTTSQ